MNYILLSRTKYAGHIPNVFDEISLMEGGSEVIKLSWPQHEDHICNCRLSISASSWNFFTLYPNLFQQLSTLDENISPRKLVGILEEMGIFELK